MLNPVFTADTKINLLELAEIDISCYVHKK